MSKDYPEFMGNVMDILYGSSDTQVAIQLLGKLFKAYPAADLMDDGPTEQN